MDALIGATGFVGGVLARHHRFDAAFNSRTISEARGRQFDTVVCAAAPGSMFEANRFPDRDRARIRNLMDHLSSFQAETFVLISTIAVLSQNVAADETASEFATDKAYGRHRRELEVFCAERFAQVLIVRAPALFAPGLRKNFLFDLLNPTPSMLNPARMEELRSALRGAPSADLETFYVWDAALGLFVLDREALEASGRRDAYDQALIEKGLSANRFTNPRSSFQYYDVGDLWGDIVRARAASVDLLHLAPAPLQAGSIYAALTGAPMPESDAAVYHEDMRTRHAALWGRGGPYIRDADQVLAALRAFHAASRSRR